MACICERGGSDGGIAGWASKLTEEWVASIWWGEWLWSVSRRVARSRRRRAERSPSHVTFLGTRSESQRTSSPWPPLGACPNASHEREWRLDTLTKATTRAEAKGATRGRDTRYRSQHWGRKTGVSQRSAHWSTGHRSIIAIGLSLDVGRDLQYSAAASDTRPSARHPHRWYGYQTGYCQGRPIQSPLRNGF